MTTVAIIEGFAGGKLLSKKFREALKTAGFEVIDDRPEAKVLIAHSAGCFDIPKDTKAQLILFIGPPYWPGMSIWRRGIRKNFQDAKFVKHAYGWGELAKKHLLQIYYFLINPRYLWLALKQKDRLDFLDNPAKKIVLVRNEDDAYCGAGLKSVAADRHIPYYELPGKHDDYYTNPNPYTDILLKELDF